MEGMMSEKNRTLGPWRVSWRATIRADNGWIATNENRDANAAFTVRAVNFFDMDEALRDARTRLLAAIRLAKGEKP